MMEDPSPGEIVEPAAVHGSQAAFCEQCRAPLASAGQGQPRRFCSDRCRLAFHARARRVGVKVILGGRKGAAMRKARRA